MGAAGPKGSNTAALDENGYASRLKAWKASGSQDNFQTWQDQNRAALTGKTEQINSAVQASETGGTVQQRAAQKNALSAALLNPNDPAAPARSPDQADTLIRDAATGTVSRLKRNQGRKQSFLGGGPTLGGSSLLGY